MTSVAVVNHGSANIDSLVGALKQIGAESAVTRDPECVTSAPIVIIPGVGHFSHAIRQLRESGLGHALKKRAAKNMPLLGICVGMHLLCSSSAEAPGETGLNVFPYPVLPRSNGINVSWSALDLSFEEDAPTLLNEFASYYFCHSFSVLNSGQEEVAATFGQDLNEVAILRKGNVVGIQFHPELSQDSGLIFLGRLLDTWRST